MRSALAGILTFLSVAPAPAQSDRQHQLDSLVSVLRKTPVDTSRVRILNRIAFISDDPTISSKYGFESLELARELKWELGVRMGQRAVARSYLLSGEFTKAFEFASRALDGALIAGSPLELSRSHTLMNAILFETGRIEESFEHATMAYEQAQLANDLEELVISGGNLVFDLMTRGKEGQAEAIALDLLDRARISGDPNNMITALYGAGVFCLNAGRYEDAILMLTEGLQIAEDHKAYLDILLLKNNLAHAYIQAWTGSGQDDLLEKAGTLYAEVLDEAIKGRIENMKLSALRGLASVNGALGEYETAFGQSQQVIHISDSFIAESHAQHTLALSKAREKAEMEERSAIHALELRTAQRQKWYFIGGLCILLTLVLVVLAQKRRIRIAKDRQQRLMDSVFPEDIARELQKNGHVEPRTFDNVTILFTDFKDFTKVVSSLSARQTVQLIDHYFRAFDRIAKQHVVEKIKTIGDAYMCVSGIPDEKPDHALRAVRAAKEMLAFVKEEEEKRSAAGEPWFKIRIGLHTGPVVAGVVGESKFAYDVWGDTVNTAARLEQHGEADRINISRTTFEYVKHRFPCTPKGYITVKHGVELELYQVEEIGELVV